LTSHRDSVELDAEDERDIAHKKVGCPSSEGFNVTG